MENIHYVLGLLFSEDRTRVALIHKLKPEWQKDKFNGIGGKIEESDDTPLDAMIREFKEETGVSILEWDNFLTLRFEQDPLGGTATVHCFRAFSEDIEKCTTTETEPIIQFDASAAHLLPSSNGNLGYLIGMALHEKIKHAHITY